MTKYVLMCVVLIAMQASVIRSVRNDEPVAETLADLRWFRCRQRMFQVCFALTLPFMVYAGSPYVGLRAWPVVILIGVNLGLGLVIVRAFGATITATTPLLVALRARAEAPDIERLT